MIKSDLKKIILFASGSGTNVEAIVKYFAKEIQVSIELLVCNNLKAKVVQKAKAFKINTLIVNRETFYDSHETLTVISKIKPDLIVLAGFLWKIPGYLTEVYTNKIINIHPALLPKFGGKGMYGINIHKKVIEQNEIQSGITIHYVNKNYDEGEVIFQKAINIKTDETAEELSLRILKLEHKFFPLTIHKLLKIE